MKIKMTLTKAEKIMALLNQWDPAGEYKESGDYHVYQFEAETIGMKLRSNSTIKTATDAVRETMIDTMDGKQLDENEVRKIAGLILLAIAKK